MLASYMGGQKFLSIGRRHLRRKEKVLDPNAVLERAFNAPPLSTEQVLHPEKYWVPEERDDPVVVIRQTTDLPKGWSVAMEDVLGELQLALVTELADGGTKIDFTNPMSMMTIKYTNSAATGWGGDSVALLAKGEGRLHHLVTVWDSEEEADEFDRTMQLVVENTIKEGLANLAGEGGSHGARIMGGNSERERVLVCWAIPGTEDAEIDELVGALKWAVPGPIEEAGEDG